MWLNKFVGTYAMHGLHSGCASTSVADSWSSFLLVFTKKTQNYYEGPINSFSTFRVLGSLPTVLINQTQQRMLSSILPNS